MAPRKPINPEISGDACIIWAVMLLILPLEWIAAAAAAAGFHELCHYLALRLCGVRLYGLRIGVGGAVMETEAMDDGRELFCALAGPAGSLALLMLVRWMPELAVCGLVQGFYNLLPIFPLDGGRAARSIFGILFPDRRDMLALWLQRGMVLLILLAGLAAFAFLKLGTGVLIVTFLLVRKALPGKRPCKERRKRVQ